MDEESIDSELKSLERDRLRAEIAKLSAEAKEVSKSVFVKPAFWAALVPILAASGTIYLAYKGEFFNAQTKLLDARKVELSAETASLTMQKLLLESELDGLNESIRSAEKRIQQLEGENKELVRRIALEPVRDALKRLAITTPRPYEESSGPALVQMIREIEGKQDAIAAIEMELGNASLSSWSNLVLLRVLQEVRPNGQENDRIIDQIGGALTTPDTAEESLKLVTELFDGEPEPYAFARCQAVGDYVGGSAFGPRMQYHLVNAYSGCKYVGLENSFQIDVEAAGNLVRWLFALKESDAKPDDLECLHLANFIKVLSIGAADAFFAKCIYDLPDSEIDLSFVEQYVEGYESIDIPPSKISGNQVSVWREFYERDIEKLSIESVLLLP